MQGSSIQCCSCGTYFTMQNDLENLRRRDGKSFYCPNGHKQYWTPPPSGEEKKIMKLEREKRDWIRTCATLREEIRELEKEPCPVCDEKFTSVGHHMAKMHPDEWKVELERRADQAALDRIQDVN